MNQIENKCLGRIACLAIGFSIVLGSQTMFAQSVSNAPRKSTKIKLLEVKIKETKDRLDQLADPIRDAKTRDGVLRNELGALEKLGNTMSVSAESYPEVLRTIHSQRVQLSIDLAGIGARYNAIEKAIDEITAEQTQRLLKPLRQLVDIHAAEVKHMKKLVGTGTISASKLRESEIALLGAKTKLAQVGSPIGGMLGHLNKQLLDTSLELAEKSARLEKASSLIKEVDVYRSHATAVEGKLQLIESNKIKRIGFENERQGLTELLILINNELQQTRDELP